MKVISIASMKGGVGKTSVVANLAHALSKKFEATAVNVLDLDSQSAVQWHFGLTDHALRGICLQAIEPGSLREVAVQSSVGVTLFPYGSADEPSRLSFEALLSERPDWLRLQLESLGLDDQALVLIDTPPGPSPYLAQALACSDLIISVLLPDAASYGTVPAMETYLDEMIPINPSLRSLYLINQLDESDELGSDMTRTLRQHLGERLVPTVINCDEALKEALAMQKTVLEYDPHGQGSYDINALACWLLGTLEGVLDQ